MNGGICHDVDAAVMWLAITIIAVHLAHAALGYGAAQFKIQGTRPAVSPLSLLIRSLQDGDVLLFCLPVPVRSFSLPRVILKKDSWAEWGRGICEWIDLILLFHLHSTSSYIHVLGGCSRRAAPVRYSAARYSGALLAGALLRCPNIATNIVFNSWKYKEKEKKMKWQIKSPLLSHSPFYTTSSPSRSVSSLKLPRPHSSSPFLSPLPWSNELREINIIRCVLVILISSTSSWMPF